MLMREFKFEQISNNKYVMQVIAILLVPHFVHRITCILSLAMMHLYKN